MTVSKPNIAAVPRDEVSQVDVGTACSRVSSICDQPFGRIAHASPPWRRAEELRQGGTAIETVSEDALRARLSPGATVAT